MDGGLSLVCCGNWRSYSHKQWAHLVRLPGCYSLHDVSLNKMCDMVDGRVLELIEMEVRVTSTRITKLPRWWFTSNKVQHFKHFGRRTHVLGSKKLLSASRSIGTLHFQSQSVTLTSHSFFQLKDVFLNFRRVVQWVNGSCWSKVLLKLAKK